MSKVKNVGRYIVSFFRTLFVRLANKNFGIAVRCIIGRYCSLCGTGSLQIQKGTVMRSLCRLEANGNLTLGERCFLNQNVSITAEESIVIGNNVCIGNNTVIVDHNHNFRHQGEGLFSSAPVVIGDNVWIGANVVVLPGTYVGNDCVIGAGTILRGRIPSQSIVYDRQELIVRSIRG